jgi:hypothetical protein
MTFAVDPKPAKKGKMAASLDEHPSGFFTPDDLHLLEVVFDAALRRDSLTADDPKATEIAKALIGAFQCGARDETSLLKAVGRWGSGFAGAPSAR